MQLVIDMKCLADVSWSGRDVTILLLAGGRGALKMTTVQAAFAAGS
jgi:hypothetical protein